MHIFIATTEEHSADDMRGVETSRSRYICVEEDGIDFLHVGVTVDSNLVKISKVVNDCSDPTTKKNKGGTHFSEVVNPVIWSSFSFQPTFEIDR